MDEKKSVSDEYHHKHRDTGHGMASRLEGVVKNKGIKPVHKIKKM